MPDGTLKCPKCGERIPLEGALRAQLEETLRPKIAGELAAKATKEAENKVAQQVELLQTELSDLNERVKTSRANELQLRKEQQRLLTEKEGMDLEIARRLDEGRATLRNELSTVVAAEYKQKELQKDKQISDMLKQIDELKRKGEQGSQQLQGEVRELDLEESLRMAFPIDEIEPVKTGARGADIIQHVRDRNGLDIGTILWEVKQTKAWSDSWLQKLKDNLREVRGDVAILLSAALPAGEIEFCAREGVWIATPRLALCLATVVRAGIENVVKATNASIGRQEKSDLVYEYVTGVEFRGCIETTIEAWKAMKSDLEAEKTVFAKHWKKREHQLNRALLGTAHLYGSIHGIVGSTLPEIDALSLKALAIGANDSESL